MVFIIWQAGENLPGTVKDTIKIQQGEIMEDPTKKEEIMDNKNEKDSKPALPTRSYVVMALAGAYVAYLGFSLCKSVLDGVEGSNPGFMVAGIVFMVLGAAFVVNGGKGYMKNSKEKKEEDAQAALEDASESEETREKSSGAETDLQDVSESEKAEETGQKKMSIADRANLVNHLNEDEEEKE